MKSSRSSTSTSDAGSCRAERVVDRARSSTGTRVRGICRTWLVLVAAMLVSLLVPARAEASRKRVVILEFSGPKADRFHSDIVKLVKRSHTVISSDKWYGIANDLGADKINAKNVAKVAKKLKVDGVITGKVDKRRDEYIITLRIRAGTTGELTGMTVRTKADGPRLGGQAQRDIKDELLGAIDELEKNRGGGGGDDDEELAEDEEEVSPRKRKRGKDVEAEEEEAPRRSRFAGRGEFRDSSRKRDDDVDEEKAALRTRRSRNDEDRRRKRKRGGDEEEVASADDDDEEGIEEEVELEDVDDELRLSPSRRAVDAVVGLSFTARRLSFKHDADLGNAPPGYKLNIPVTGALLDVTIYPMAYGGQDRGTVSHLGLNVLYDQVLLINSKKQYIDGQNMLQEAILDTKESRWSVGAVYRYPLGKHAKAPVVGGSLSYGKQQFTVAQTLPDGMPSDIPNVEYTMIVPSAFARLPLLPKININADVSFLAVTNTGEIQTSAQYGAATVTGFEFQLGVDYMLTKNIFARGGLRLQTIGIDFKGDPTSLAALRDSDPEQDVQSARDTYFGGTATIGYVY